MVIFKITNNYLQLNYVSFSVMMRFSKTLILHNLAVVKYELKLAKQFWKVKTLISSPS